MSRTSQLNNDAKQILSELEDLWKKFDKIYSALSEEDWNKKYGKEWIFADQPFHLAFFDRMVAKALMGGSKKGKLFLKDMAQINAWNESEFRKRPKHFTYKQSLEEFRRSHEDLRKAASKINKWDQQVWMPLFFGWGSAKDCLNASLVHSAGEYMELCMRVKKPIDLLTSTMKRREQFMMLFMSLSFDKKAAMRKDFTLAWNFIGRGPSSWIVKIEKGEGKLIEGKTKQADLTMTMTLETFEKMLRKMKNSMLMMLTREIKIQGFSKMPTFMKLFPQP